MALLMLTTLAGLARAAARRPSPRRRAQARTLVLGPITWVD
ncbi:MAG: hypothetical protein QNJ13_12390 [Paracoccaceae bacterium]|nr:hypothetical protein [Paracoccaceae bacterium]